jgi:DNA (cytosine-5)-methyltransferase 1
VGFAEIDKFPSRVLAHHYPDVPNFGDFTTIDTTKLGRVDLLVGGTPCQAFSIAGNRLSLQDARGNLSLAYTVLAHELARSNGMRWAVWENVPGVLSTQDNAFGSFLGGIVGADDPIVCPAGIERWPDAGMVSGPRSRAAWGVLDAQFFGLAQRRRRVFVVAGFGEGADPAKVLFERKSMYGNSPPRRETRERAAAPIAARTRGGGGLGTDLDCDGGLIASTGDVSHCLNAGGMGRIDYETETMVAHSLRADGFDASEDGTGRGTPIVPICFSAKDHGGDAQVDLSPTLRAGGFDGSHANAGVMPAIAFDARQSDVIQYGNMTGPLDTDGHTMAVAIQAGALRENPTSGPDGVGVQADLAHTIEARAEVQAVAFAENSRAELRLEGGDGQIVSSLKVGGGKPGQSYPAIVQQWAVRRLTPTECARLQGFPDEYLDLPGAADGPKYKALGNSFAVPVVAWLGKRIAASG